jgi:periplasmic protein TonB
MWEKTLIESKGGKKRRWWMFPLSLFLHSLIIGIIVGMSYWMVEAVQAPPIPVTLYSAPPPPPPPPPAAAKRKAAPEKPKPKPEEKVEVPKEVQPTIPEEIPEEDLTPTETPVDEGIDTGVEEGGVPGGVEGGVVGGVEGGVPGGVIGGVPGGVIGGTPGGMGDEVPMRITAEVKQPQLIKKVEPPYPEVGRRSKLEGVVVLEAVITKTGSVEEVKVLRSLHPVMDQAALNAVKQWKYKPAILNGRPVKVYFTVTVTFRLA